MGERNYRRAILAAAANVALYDPEATRAYVDGTPHVKHASLRALYQDLVREVVLHAAEYATPPTVLDLGAGEGSTTLPFLEFGARVTVVDSSASQLSALQDRCRLYQDRLAVIHAEVGEALNMLKSEGKKYDIIAAISFLHHIPDYLGLIDQAIPLLTSTGQVFSFQDPLRYDSVSWFTRLVTNITYFSWRVFKGDLVEGFKTRVRRIRGIYLDDNPRDVAEYHVVRNGVDQIAIMQLLKDLGFDAHVVLYFSTQSRLWQPVGTALGIKNTFGVVAKKGNPCVSSPATAGVYSTSND